MKCAIGVDIGGTNIRAGAVSSSGRVLVRASVPTAAQHAPEIVARIISVIQAVKQETAGLVPVGVGIGVPGVVTGGIVRFMPNIQRLQGVHLKKLLQRALHRPLVIENDANCFALGEFLFGAGKGTTTMAGVTLGTGIGGGLVLDGKLYHGSGFGNGSGSFAMEVGHMIIDPAGIRCACGNKGDLESWCAGPNVTRHYRCAGGRMLNPDPAQIFHSRERIAQRIKRQTMEKLALGLANLQNLLDPDVIVLGGGMSSSVPVAQLNRLAKRLAVGRRITIVKGKLGEHAGVVGAGMVALG